MDRISPRNSWAIDFPLGCRALTRGTWNMARNRHGFTGQLWNPSKDVVCDAWSPIWWMPDMEVICGDPMSDQSRVTVCTDRTLSRCRYTPDELAWIQTLAPDQPLLQIICPGQLNLVL